jgi:hypothetical protein
MAPGAKRLCRALVAVVLAVLRCRQPFQVVGVAARSNLALVVYVLGRVVPQGVGLCECEPMRVQGLVAEILP